MIKSQVQDTSTTQTILIIWVISNVARDVARVDLYGAMVRYTRANGKMVRRKAAEFGREWMTFHMLVNGTMILYKGLGCWLTKTRDTRGSLEMS